MPDKLTPEQRHKCMSHIRGRDTKPELWVRRFLYAHGYRYRLQERRLPGRPDITMRRLHTVIMVNGCFWHGHMITIGKMRNEELEVNSSECCKIPKSRTEFWVEKILRNQQRDARDRDLLKSMGWNVITIWECELKPAVREATLQRLLFTLSQIELALVKPKMKSYALEEDSPIRMVADDDPPCPF